MQTTQENDRKDRWISSQVQKQQREFAKLPFTRFPPKTAAAA